MADPAIILVSEHHAGVLLEEFESRYQRDYELRTATNTAQAEEVAREIGDAGGLVAMFVTDSRLPDVDHIFEAIHRWRVVVPTAAGWSRRTGTTSSRTARGFGSAWPRASTTPTC